VTRCGMVAEEFSEMRFVPMVIGVVRAVNTWAPMGRLWLMASTCSNSAMTAPSRDPVHRANHGRAQRIRAS
jgi:hypothetical protein